MRIRLTEMQRNCLRLGYTLGNGLVAVNRADTLSKLVELRLVVADADGKGGQLTAQGTSVAIALAENPNRTTFDIMSPAEFDQWEREQSAGSTPEPAPHTSSLSFLNSTPNKRHTGAERYPHGKNLPDDSDVSHASTADLVVSLCTALDNLTRTNNVTSLATVGSHIGRIWWELVGRGIEFA
ncbi:hypothetical protein [Streptomyces hygroscopicus]|uniref:hypothetical protein n=1 Tax=Streptomyces hygroscopicus TaxID=1912 RepID=UPI0033F705CA